MNLAVTRSPIIPPRDVSQLCHIALPLSQDLNRALKIKVGSNLVKKVLGTILFPEYDFEKNGQKCRFCQSLCLKLDSVLCALKCHK